jgi:Sulfotransferase family
MADPPILYITGWMRSGSTLLGNVLGELPGVLHVGELHYLWRNGVLNAGSNASCGCGADLTECGIWSSVLGASRPAMAAAARQMVALQDALLRTRHTRARLAEARGRARPAQGVDEATGRTAAIYQQLAQHGGKRLIVDGSKYPAEAAALLGRADLDVRVLHMVRDPRATAFSYQRAKAYIEPMSPARSSAYWSAFNLASELVGGAAAGRYLRIRHEDLCRRPRQVLAEVMRFAGLSGEPPADEAGRVALGLNHTVTGNPDRLQHGDAVIRSDERWRTGLSRAQIAAATAPALPMLARYGYPLLPLS